MALMLASERPEAKTASTAGTAGSGF